MGGAGIATAVKYTYLEREVRISDVSRAVGGAGIATAVHARRTKRRLPNPRTKRRLPLALCLSLSIAFAVSLSSSPSPRRPPLAFAAAGGLRLRVCNGQGLLLILVK